MDFTQLQDLIQEILDSDESIIDESNLRLADEEDPIYEDEYGTTTVKFYGGLNGAGDWGDYLTALTYVIDNLNQSPDIANAYVIDIKNDPPDDVFDVYLGVRFEEVEKL